MSCIGSDEDGTIIEQILGVVSDISQNGLLIESIQKVESANLSLIASTKNNRLIEINSNKNITKKISQDILQEFGVESYLGIPLLAGKNCVGIISLVFTRQVSSPSVYTKKIHYIPNFFLMILQLMLTFQSAFSFEY